MTLRILLSNDDGYFAPGLAALAQALSALGTVTVVAPERDRSGASNSLTLDRPLSVRKASNGFHYVNGTPTDCVHLAVTGLLDHLPDVIVSGINHGANMGDDTIYSGTVGAAMEGYLFGIPAIAFSQTEKGWACIDAAAQRARAMVLQLMPSLEVLAEGALPTVAPWLLNVNIPNLPDEQILGVKVARLGRRHAAERVITQTSPRGETMYWIGGAGPAKDEGDGTDFHATKHQFVSVTPLQVDLTDHEHLALWTKSLAQTRS